MIRFLNPEFLWLLALLPLLALWRGRKGRVAAVEYSNVEIARTVARETRSRPARWTTMLRLLVATLLILGLARPQLGQGRTEVQTSGVDLMLALDVSGSMEALDFNLGNQPASRVEVVKSVVSKFIDARPNDRIGMVVFAGDALAVARRNAKDLNALRALGERNYVEFDVSRKDAAKKLGDISITLKKADVGRNRYTVAVSADDKLVEKRDRTINEPVQLGKK